VKLTRNVIAFLILAVTAAHLAQATTDESILGNYAFADQSFCISFEWQLDSLHNLVVRGEQYEQDIPLIPNGLSGAFYSYDATLPRKANSKTVEVLHIDALLNSDDKALIVTGVFVELAHDNSGVERVVYSKIFKLRRIQAGGPLLTCQQH
jgi:hypothetical protein